MQVLIVSAFKLQSGAQVHRQSASDIQAAGPSGFDGQN
jgi:hypothetical protein